MSLSNIVKLVYRYETHLINFHRKLKRTSLTPCKKLFSTIEIPGKRYIPRRAVLYIPGSDQRKIDKIPNLDVDCVVLDCEDGVSVNSKEAARLIITNALDTIDFGRTEPVVRINSYKSELAEEDLRAILQATKLPPTIMLPKVEETVELEWLAEKLVSILKETKRKQKFNLIIFIESAIGLLNFESICRRAVELRDLGVPLTLDGVVFGSDDFCANIGALRTKEATEILYARQKVVLVAKAFQMQAIDLVDIDFKDLDGLRRQSVEGAKMGFTGKQVIHPTQVPIVQECFTPSQETVAWATELITTFYEHQKQGKGAFVFRGNMIDMPLLKQAENIVHLMEDIQKSNSTESLNKPNIQPGESQSADDSQTKKT